MTYSINSFGWSKILIKTIVYLLMHKTISLGISHCLYLHGLVLSELGTINASCHTICLKDQFQPCRVLTHSERNCLISLHDHFIDSCSQGASVHWLKRLSNIDRTNYKKNQMSFKGIKKISSMFLFFIPHSPPPPPFTRNVIK